MSGDSLFYDGRKATQKDRVLREVGFAPEASPANNEQVYQTRIDSAYEQLADVINAANAVLPEYENMAQTIVIPVDELAIDVRSAVKRKDNTTPDGNIIKFDLFKDAIENYDRLRLKISTQAASQLDGNPPLDSIRIESLRREIENGDLNTSELALFASTLLIRIVLAKLQEKTTIPTVQTIAATKFPPIVEIPPSTVAIVASIFLQLLIEIINENALNIAVNDITASTSVNTKKYISDAKNYTKEPTKLEQIAIRRVGEADYHLILEYAMNYIANSLDPHFDVWLAYVDSKQIRNKAIAHYKFGPQYSSKELALINNVPEPEPVFSRTDTVISNNPASYYARLEGLVAMTPEHLCMIEQDASALQNNLHLIATVMSSRFAADTVCCLTRFFGHMGPDSIKALRAIMAFAQGLLKERLTLDIAKTLSNITNYLSNAIRDLLMSQLERTIQFAVNPTLNDLQFPDKEWELLIRGCPLIERAVDFILKTIGQILSKLREIILNIGFDGIQFNSHVEYRYTNLYEMRTLKIIIDLLDRIASAIINNDCSVDQDGRILLSEFAEFSDSITANQRTYTVELPKSLIETYFPNSEPIQVEETETRPSYAIPSLKETAEAGLSEKRIMREIMDRCGQTISDEDLDRIFGLTNGNN